MFYVYILISQKTGKYYVGQTVSIDERILRHNSGMVKSTKAGVPWKVVRSFSVSSRSEAVILEKRIKKRGAKRYLNDIGM